MGANPSDEMASGDEKPRHEVTLRPFYVGVAAVLQEQWQRVMGNSPSQFKGDRHPVERVSWDDAKRFLEILDSRLRLPTEAEWEYAARGGREGDRYPWGNELSASNAKYGGGGTVPVGMFAANGFGLYDMSGNVLEWCGDWFDERYYAKSPSRDPQGPSGGSGRVVRGGSWYYVGGGGLLRVSNRDRNVPTKRNDGLGFRCVRDAGSP